MSKEYLGTINLNSIKNYRKLHNSLRIVSDSLFENEFDSFKELSFVPEIILSFSKYKVGDRVYLSETPVINKTESWGWLGARHFLVKGSPAIVKNVEVMLYKTIDNVDTKFRYGLSFDHESIIYRNCLPKSCTSFSVEEFNRHSFYYFDEDKVGYDPSSYSVHFYEYEGVRIITEIFNKEFRILLNKDGNITTLYSKVLEE